MDIGIRPTAGAPVPRHPEGCDHVALVLQGGGALGAYQAGVYQALHEAGLEPDGITGALDRRHQRRHHRRQSAGTPAAAPARILGPRHRAAAGGFRRTTTRRTARMTFFVAADACAGPARVLHAARPEPVVRTARQRRRHVVLRLRPRCARRCCAWSISTCSTAATSASPAARSTSPAATTSISTTRSQTFAPSTSWPVRRCRRHCR